MKQSNVSVDFFILRALEVYKWFLFLPCLLKVNENREYPTEIIICLTKRSEE